MNNQINEIAVIVLQSVIGDEERKIQWQSFASRFAAETAFSLRETDNPGEADFVFLATGGVEQSYASRYISMPRAIYAPRMTNAFAAMNEIRGYLAKKGENAFCFDESRISLDEFVRIAHASRLIHGAQIAMYGAPAPWLIASFPSRDQFQAKFHSTIRYAAWEDLHWETCDKQIVSWRELNASGVDSDDLRRASSLSAAMLANTNINRDDAVTVGCFPLLAQHVSACLAVSDLLTNGFAAACENDICSVMGMLAAQYLGLCAQPPWMANLVDIQNDTITLQHCTIARTGLLDCMLMTHFESGANVAVAGTLKSSIPVTVFRFSEDFGRACIVEGTIVESGPNPLGCRTSATIKLDHPFPSPLGNHHILVVGHVAHILREFCRMMNIDPEIGKP